MLSKKVITRLIIIGIAIALNYIGFSDYLTLDTIKLHKDSLTQFVQYNYLFSIVLYVLIYIGAVALFFPSASIITLTGGYLFGSFVGAVCSILAATIGASISFVIIRYFFADTMRKRYTKQMKRFNRAIREDGISFLLFVRLIALFPFFIINIVLALLDVPFTTFFWTTAIGIIPGTSVYAFAGKQLHLIESGADILSPSVLAAFVLLALLALLPVIIKWLRIARKG